jgi:RNA polymerase subunit RPABC4/transcription elongation factor Spt4
MRYCHNCHRITGGEPLYCHLCGSSFDAKLCPSRHLNPRWAVVCSQCGSRDLSTPAPRLPLWLAPGVFFLTLVPGLVLALLLVLLVIGVINALLTNQQIQLQLMVLILIVSILWYAYIHLPHFVKDLFRSVWRRKKKDGRPH